jgi:hypothetical protein
MELLYYRKQPQTKIPGFANFLLCNSKSDGMGLKRVTAVCETSVFGTLRRRLITRVNSTRNSTIVTQQRLHQPATVCKLWPQETEEEMTDRPAAIHNTNLE